MVSSVSISWRRKTKMVLRFIVLFCMIMLFSGVVFHEPTTLSERSEEKTQHERMMEKRERSFSMLLGIALGSVVAGCVAVEVLIWRCPSCHTYLGLTSNPNFCSHCGIRFD